MVSPTYLDETTTLNLAHVHTCLHAHNPARLKIANRPTALNHCSRDSVGAPEHGGSRSRHGSYDLVITACFPSCFGLWKGVGSRAVCFGNLLRVNLILPHVIPIQAFVSYTPPLYTSTPTQHSRFDALTSAQPGHQTSSGALQAKDLGWARYLTISAWEPDIHSSTIVPKATTLQLGALVFKEWLFWEQPFYMAD